MPSRHSLLEAQDHRVVGRALTDPSLAEAVNALLYRSSEYYRFRAIRADPSPMFDGAIWVVRDAKKGRYLYAELHLLDVMCDAASNGVLQGVYNTLTKQIDKEIQEDWEYIERQIAGQHD